MPCLALQDILNRKYDIAYDVLRFKWRYKNKVNFEAVGFLLSLIFIK